jgi:hypothetical protein
MAPAGRPAADLHRCCLASMSDSQAARQPENHAYISRDRIDPKACTRAMEERLIGLNPGRGQMAWPRRPERLDDVPIARQPAGRRPEARGALGDTSS